MVRPVKDDGKRVTISAKVSETVAAAIDGRRGNQTRSSWLETVVSEALAHTYEIVLMGPSVTPRTARGPRTPAISPEMTGVLSHVGGRPDEGECPHPKAMVTKGVCRCGAGGLT
jgi:hypothetical protein